MKRCPKCNITKPDHIERCLYCDVPLVYIEEQKDKDLLNKANDAFLEALDIEENSMYDDDIIEAYQKVININNKHAGAHHRLGLFYYQLGLYCRAKKELEEAGNLAKEVHEPELLDELEHAISTIENMESNPHRFEKNENIQVGEEDKVIDRFYYREYFVNVCEPGQRGDGGIHYRYRADFFEKANSWAVFSVTMEFSNMGTTAIGMFNEHGHINWGSTHKDVSYGEFKYRMLKIVDDYLRQRQPGD